jgi:hypothetical protein
MGVLRGIFGLSTAMKADIASKVAKQLSPKEKNLKTAQKLLKELRTKFRDAPKGSAERAKIFEESQKIKKQYKMKTNKTPEDLKPKPKTTKPKTTTETKIDDIGEDWNFPTHEDWDTEIADYYKNLKKPKPTTKFKTTTIRHKSPWKKKTGGRVYKKGGKSIKAGLDILQAAHTKREPKVEKKRKESKDAYEMALLVGGSVPLVGPLTKVPKIVAKGLKAAKKSKKGMRPALKVINPTSGQLKPRPTGQLRKRYKGGSIKKKSGGKVQYRSIGGKVSGNDIIKMIYD